MRPSEIAKDFYPAPNQCNDCIFFPKCGEYPFDESGCKDFKDQALFVELPCRVGTQVWLTEWWGFSHLQWLKQIAPLPRNIHHFDIMKDGVFAHFRDGCINVKYFGECVFLTIEEAKAALRKDDT